MENSEQLSIEWSDYIKYRIDLRGFNLEKVEKILRCSAERYFDVATQRRVVIGRHDKLLVMIPYEESEGKMNPITVHATTRQQINFRLKTGRIKHG